MAQTIYGVALNDPHERERLADAFTQPPYRAAPIAPVLYVKPQACRVSSPSVIAVPRDAPRLDAGPTFALFFPGPPGLIGGVALALDVSEPQPDYYRPAVRRQGRDGFLPIGAFRPWTSDEDLVSIFVRRNGDTTVGWRPERLVRNVAVLVADIGAFMSLVDGDILLVGLQAEPVEARVGDRVELTAAGHPPLKVSFVAQDAT